MKKYSKKIALILVLALVLAVSIPALAANNETEIKGEYQAVVIAIDIPQNGEVIINPFALPVKLMAQDGASVIGEMKKCGQITTTKPVIGVNRSEFDLKIGASVKGEATGFTLATSAPAATATTKTGLVYLAIDNANYKIAKDTNASTSVAGDLKGEDVLTVLETLGQPAKYDNTKHLVIGKTAVSKKALCTVRKATDDGTGTMVPAADSYFVGRLCGNVVQLPATAWTANDKLTVNITWIIEPSV